MRMFIAILVIIVSNNPMSTAEKKNVVYSYNTTNYKKGHTTETCNNMGKSQKHHGEYKKPDPTGFILYDSIYIQFLEKAEL